MDVKVFINNSSNMFLGYSDIGRLEVGTETPVDKSKSIKSMLMRLFDNCDNKNVEGVDSINACYGGTAALFNSIAWIECSAWNGTHYTDIYIIIDECVFYLLLK